MIFLFTAATNPKLETISICDRTSPAAPNASVSAAAKRGCWLFSTGSSGKTKSAGSASQVILGFF